MSERPRIESRTVSAALNGHNNSFGGLRFFFAALVIFSHAYDMGAFGVDPLYFITGRQFHMGTFAVFAFLGISGYVVTKSAASADALQFIWRRVLRIFPAFWGVLLVSAFIVGPAAWLRNGKPLIDYFTADEYNPFTYITKNWTLSLGQLYLPGLFENNPLPGIVNRSLWTLDYEWWCYLLIGALALVGVLAKARWLIPVLAVAFLGLEVATTLNHAALAEVPYLRDQARVRFTLVFLWGATFAMYSRRVPFRDSLGFAAIAIVVASSLLGGFYIIGLPALLYALIWGAVRFPKRAQIIGRDNDYSYGIYLYGALVQQIGAALGWYQWGYWPWTIASVLIAFACAWLSWHIIEKNAMRLKPVGPGRGIRYWVDVRYPAAKPAPARA